MSPLLIIVCLILFQAEKFSLVVTAFRASLPNRQQPRHERTTKRHDELILVLHALSSEEAIERLRQQQADRAVMEQEQPPMLFDDDMINVMNEVYMTLEKRVQEGPGSLSVDEINQLDIRLQMITEEMRINEHNRPKKPAATATIERDANPSFQQQSLPSAIRPPPATDTSLDEGPVYTGRGGMGQPQGTVNTYAIPGMDEMTPEEYITALQQQVINTQNERRRKFGSVGNKSTWSYLSTLSGQTEGILKRKKGILDDMTEETN